jgi:tetratricopeptide (TPR) repeat protein
MSVLNQMLKDLEARGIGLEPAAPAPAVATEAPSAPILRPRLVPQQPIAPAPMIVRIAVWGGVSLVIAATTAGYFWYAKHINDSVRAPQPLGAQQFAGVAAAAPMPAGPAAAAAAPAPVAAATPTPPSTTPMAPSAAMPAPPAPVAAPAAAPESAPVTVAAVTAQPASLQARPRAAPATAPATAANAAKEAPAAAQADLASIAVRPERRANAPGPDASTGAPGAEPQNMIVTRPADSNDALEARAAEFIARGRNAEAIALLEQVILRTPAAGNARATLAALQSESGRRDFALATLLDGSRIEPIRFAAAAARLQAELGDAPAALTTLDLVPAASRSATHQALAAGIAQRAGEHRRAVEAYQIALREPGAPAVWWVGLAMSLDALEQRAAALEAFRRAAADRSLPMATRNFVAGRINALAASPGAPAGSGEARVAASN